MRKVLIKKPTLWSKNIKDNLKLSILVGIKSDQMNKKERHRMSRGARKTCNLFFRKIWSDPKPLCLLFWTLTHGLPICTSASSNKKFTKSMKTGTRGSINQFKYLLGIIWMFLFLQGSTILFTTSLTWAIYGLTTIWLTHSMKMFLTERFKWKNLLLMWFIL